MRLAAVLAGFGIVAAGAGTANAAAVPTHAGTSHLQSQTMSPSDWWWP